MTQTAKMQERTSTTPALMPNFLIIGAAKSGTTALYEYLRGHPDIYMTTVKEPRFFALEGDPLSFGGPWADLHNKVSIHDLETYQALFDGWQGQKAIGEASPLYLYDPKAPERIQHYIPDARLIAMLRNPVERAFSGYVMSAMQGREKLSFAEAIEDEPRRIRENWIWGRYVDVGFYAGQLERYFNRFDRSQIRVYLYDDLKADTASVVNDVFDFLNVSRDYSADTSVHHNASGMPKNKLLDLLVGKRPSRYWLKPLKPYLPRSLFQLRDWLWKRNLERPLLEPAMRLKLTEIFRDDILRVQDLLERDLSGWLEPRDMV